MMKGVAGMGSAIKVMMGKKSRRYSIFGIDKKTK
jgi:hypothetical protein